MTVDFDFETMHRRRTLRPYSGKHTEMSPAPPSCPPPQQEDKSCHSQPVIVFVDRDDHPFLYTEVADALRRRSKIIVRQQARES